MYLFAVLLFSVIPEQSSLNMKLRMTYELLLDRHEAYNAQLPRFMSAKPKNAEIVDKLHRNCFRRQKLSFVLRMIQKKK